MSRTNISSRSFSPMALFVALLMLCAPALAGVGYSDSESALLDTRNPELVLDPVPEHLVLYSGQEYPFHWSTLDDNPGVEAADYQATITAEGLLIEETSWYPNPGEFTWTWQAPEIQSALCRLEVVVRDVMGNTTSRTSDAFTVLYSTTDAPDLPTALQWAAPVPNPFNPACQLALHLPWQCRVTVAVHDVRGRRVRLLSSETRSAGRHTLLWDGTDAGNRPQPGGVYFFVADIESPEGPVRMTRRATLLP
jgi:hypothetical protein